MVAERVLREKEEAAKKEAERRARVRKRFRRATGKLKFLPKRRKRTQFQEAALKLARRTKADDPFTIAVEASLVGMSGKGELGLAYFLEEVLEHSLNNDFDRSHKATEDINVSAISDD